MIIKFNYNDYNELSNVVYYNDNNDRFKIEHFNTNYKNWEIYKIKEIYLKNGLYHNLNKPAIKIFNENGVSIYNGYFNKGNKHNSVGPAEIYSGYQDFETFYFLHGRCIEKNRFLNLLENKLNDN